MADTKVNLLADDEEDEVTTDNLEFHDYMTSLPSKSEETFSSTPSGFTQFPAPDDDSDNEGKSELLRGQKAALSFWTFEYYQSWFDIDTYNVLRRILWSMVPLPRSNYLEDQIRPNPDLYGPFWICTTLVFTTAICGNLANYISCGQYEYSWSYDFHKVTGAAAAVFAYWLLIPCAIWGLLWWRGSKSGYTFMEMICIYGYSLSVFIPISILWVIPYAAVQWILLIIGTALSGSVLLLTFRPAVDEDNKKIVYVALALIFVFHLALAAGFVLYFFHVPESNCHIIPTSPTTLKTTHAPAPSTIIKTTLRVKPS